MEQINFDKENPITIVRLEIMKALSTYQPLLKYISREDMKYFPLDYVNKDKWDKYLYITCSSMNSPTDRLDEETGGTNRATRMVPVNITAFVKRIDEDNEKGDEKHILESERILREIHNAIFVDYFKYCNRRLVFNNGSVSWNIEKDSQFDMSIIEMDFEAETEYDFGQYFNDKNQVSIGDRDFGKVEFSDIDYDFEVNIKNKESKNA